jgi:hypothetical protein
VTVNGVGPFSGQATFTASRPPTAWTVPGLAGCAVSGTQTPGTWSGESFAAHFLALGAIYPFATLPGLITQVAVPSHRQAETSGLEQTAPLGGTGLVA